MHDKLREREIKIENEENFTEVRNKNKNLMECAIYHVEETEKNNLDKRNALRKTNVVSMYEEVLLPCELFVLNGKRET